MSYRINWTLLGALTIACLLMPASGAIAADDEAAITRLLQSSQTPLEQKDQLCQKLRTTGTPASVPALATLLTDENLSHSARLALQAMPCPEAGQALREALPKTAGKIRAGIIDSLGFRRDRQAVASIAGFLQGTDSIVASSAALALGRIGAPESAAALQAARRSAAPAVQVVIADGLLLCADAFLAAGDPRTATGIYQDIFTSEKLEHLRAAAYCGLIRSAGDNAAELIIKGLTGNDRASLMAALQGVRQPQGAGATTAIVSTLHGLSTPVQLALIAALAQRGDTAAAPAIVALMQSPTLQVRLAAVKALDALGDASTAILLARAAARTSGAEQELARQSLALIRDPKTRETLLAALPKAPAAVQNEIVRALGQRQEVLAVPDLLKMAAGNEPATRLIALKSLAMLADSGNLSDLIALLRAASTDAERDAAEQALITSCARSEHPQSCVPAILAATKTPSVPEVPVRVALLRVAGRLGGVESLNALRASLQDSQAAIQDAALRSMAEYASLEAADDLLKLAADQDRSVSHRVLALRGYWRLVGAAEGRSIDERWRMCQAGLAVSQRPEEIRLGLAELSKVSHPDALKLAESISQNPALRGEAETACVRIALALAGSQPAIAKEALQRIDANTKSDGVRAEARKALESLNQYVGYVTSWVAAGPYRQPGKQCAELFDIPFAPEKSDAGIAWKPVAAPKDPALFGQFDLLGLADGDQSVVYAKSRVFSPRQQKVRLEIGSDDGNRIWINGKVVHSNNVQRPLQPGSDRVEAVLNEGWNDLLVKITQNNMGCGLCIRIRDVDGSPIDGIKFDASAENR